MSFAAKYWWIGIPVSAMSFVSLCLDVLERLGFNASQWLQIVHDIIIRWNFWLVSSLEWVAALVSLKLYTNESELNAILLMTLLLIPATYNIFTLARHQSRYFQSYFALGILAIFVVTIPVSLFVQTDDYSNVDQFSPIALLTILLMSLILTYTLARTRLYFLLFFATAILSIEILRIVPALQPSVDSFQNWLEDVPTKYTDESSA
ncbi:MAG: hypothetical protein DHS20C05_18210 [Hyphococcus sp.]|nr:MAG: hypothetical protein DHS20C05_18210 [Marinicaulis sp.]